MELIEEYEDSVIKDYLPFFGFLVLLVFCVIYEMINIGSPRPYSIKQGFQGTVTSKFVNKSYVYVGLTNAGNKQEIRNAYNYAYEPSHLISFIEVGDEVLKNDCSDTVYIKRGAEDFHFIQLAYWYNDETRTKEYKKEWMIKRLLRLNEEGCDVESIAVKYEREIDEMKNNEN